MKQATYTLACNKTDVENHKASKVEEKFEKYMESVVKKMIKSDKTKIDKWFFHVRIEE